MREAYLHNVQNVHVFQIHWYIRAVAHTYFLNNPFMLIHENNDILYIIQVSII